MFSFWKRQFDPRPRSTHELGRFGEQWAQEAYKREGYQVVGSRIFNHTGKMVGEIDFIATQGTTIAFVEVKTRSAYRSTFGTALESVNFTKQRKILKAAKLFLHAHPEYAALTPRIDVTTVVYDFDKNDRSVIIYKNVVEDQS